MTFTVTNPTQFFGAYISGIQTAFFNDVITFSNGSSQAISIPGAGLDDVRYQSVSSSASERGSMALMLGGLGIALASVVVRKVR